MQVNHKHYRTVWMEGSAVFMIDQNLLPFEFSLFKSVSCSDTCIAIKDMTTRGAGAIGAAAGFAMAQGALEAPAHKYAEALLEAKKTIEQTRPTANDLFFAVNEVYKAACINSDEAVKKAMELADTNATACRQIGEHGSKLLQNHTRIATHCNAGWLAFVDYGSALSPVYVAKQQNKNIFVYADETRPRSQGGRLTGWELYNENIDHAIIPDNATAWLMKKGEIDLVITGADRIAANGDVANKIGTLEKAIAAKYYGIPFYVAAPLSTIDKNTPTGEKITIEERNADEVHYATGPDPEGKMRTIRLTNPNSNACNPAFDVTPAELITGIITEKGVIHPTDIKDIILIH
ncbi:MAG: S-methyl-5-thioribose-1-phosphate isomerase [Salinivirgaceae bacterium]|jgi:methylthioribose-1-phosphate isomerase|nr:S-methyl-5-thioribose-1-phosphate isomerase [Salinivirgaceae bacterium]